MHRLTFAIALALTVSLTAQTVEVAPATPAAQAVRTLVDAGRIDEMRQADFSAWRTDIRNFYAPIGYRTVWSVNGRATSQAVAVIALMENAETHGLNPLDYDAGRWAARSASLTNDAAIARFDVAMTASLARYTSDLGSGRVDPQSVRFDFDGDAKKAWIPRVVLQAATSLDPAATLAAVAPQTAEYRNLIAALKLWREIAAKTAGNEPLPVVAKLAPGAEYEALPQMAELLRVYGDLEAGTVVDGTRYEGAIVDAVKRFQERHGLDQDGVISKKTFAALNVPASQRVRQIELALERARWNTQPQGAAILVNIPEFRLRARDGKGGELTMRVVVGKAASSQTPIFDDSIKHVVLRPYWNVPPSIQRGEIVPKLARDRAYLATHNYEVVDGSGRSLGSSVSDETLRKLRAHQYSVRQKPGAGNALGLMKFSFPNENNIYLHSTPQQALFARSRRDFSHGCIRVEDPVALAAWTLREQPEWSEEKIKAAIKGDRDDLYVKLAQPLPVVLYYTTAVADGTTVRFYEDIYGHDVKLSAALDAKSARIDKTLLAQNGAAMQIAAR